MKKFLCDRCGKELPPEKPMGFSLLPYYNIVAVYSVFDVEDVDLCPECKEEFKRWLKNDRK